MSPTHRSPSSGSAAAATTPARVAEEFGGKAFWRQLPDGQIEVATLRDGVVERHLVHEDGSTTLVGTSPSPPAYRWRIPLAIGAVLVVGTITAHNLSGTVDDPVTTAFFLVGVALLVMGGARRSNARNLDERIAKEEGGKTEWHPPTNLNGWLPRTSAQLAAVEQIADEHDGVAFVHDVGGRTVEVCAQRRGRIERYWVDEGGYAELADVKAPKAAYYVNRIVRAAALAVWIGAIVVLVSPLASKVEIFLALGFVFAVAAMVSWGLIASQGLERRVKRFADDGYPWIEIRTLTPDPDSN
jgi:hypothetical protein